MSSLLGLLAVADGALEPAPLGEVELAELAGRVEVGQLARGRGAGLDALGQVDLLGRR